MAKDSKKQEIERLKEEEARLKAYLEQLKKECDERTDDENDENDENDDNDDNDDEDDDDDENDDDDDAPAAGPSIPFTEDAPDEDDVGDDAGDDGSPLSTPPDSPKDPDASSAPFIAAPAPAPAPARPISASAGPPSAPPSSSVGPPHPAIQPTIATNIGGQSQYHWQAPALAAGGSREPPRDVLSFDGTGRAHWVNTVLFLAYKNPARWSNLLGVYFQTGERAPREASGQWNWASGLNGFERNWRLLDSRKASGQSLTPFSIPADDKEQNVVYQGSQSERDIFEEAVSRWARDPSNKTVAGEILWAAFWWDRWGPNNDDWQIMHNILKMPEGPEKVVTMNRAQAESPLFFAACLEDVLCGTSHETVLRTLEDGQEVEEVYEISQRAIGPFRFLQRRNILAKRRNVDIQDTNIQYKRRRIDSEDTMNTYSANGRPTQFHAVPPEERAYDENGNQLPWALEWPDDHPNARGQKRRPVETGPFGKSMRRKGSSRATRTATPAKKESSAVDGFLRGIEEDKRRAELYNEGRESIAPSTALQQDSAAAPTNSEPVQVMLYGFSECTQWAAINFYERASGGMICEDYDRHPPPEARRIPTVYSSPGMVRRRALTPLEKKLSMSYKGGKSWIRVTFDSAEAAERACESGPHIAQGYWVYAELYAHGIIPNNDEPIPCRPEDRQPGLTTPAKPSHVLSHRTTQSLGSAFSRNMQTRHPQTTATLPRSFTSNTTPHAETTQRLEADSGSPSTASSATATAPMITTAADPITLRRRGSEAQGQSDPANTTSLPQGNMQYMRYFPDVPRTVLRPVGEAFLPQSTLTQKALKHLEDLGLIPGDVIGNLVPRTETGEFDWANANFYWKFFFWMDTTFGTDMCGLKED